MDIIKKMTLWAGRNPRTEGGVLMLAAIEHMQRLQQEVRLANAKADLHDHTAELREAWAAVSANSAGQK